MSLTSPIPCFGCGINFMRHSQDENVPKMCNSCLLKYHKVTIVTGKEMEKPKILIECDRQTHIEIEELCTNEGKSISEYLIGLHKLNTQQGWKVKQCLDSGIKLPHCSEENKDATMITEKSTDDLEKKLKHKGYKK